MTNEPQRPVEQALRDYGRRRVEQTAPAELHPATRAMLQAEVGRVIARPLAASSDEAVRNFARPFASTPHQPGWLARFWPRLAFAGTVAAAFAVVVTVLRNDSTRSPNERVLTDSELKSEPLVRAPLPAAHSTDNYNFKPALTEAEKQVAIREQTELLRRASGTEAVSKNERSATLDSDVKAVKQMTGADAARKLTVQDRLELAARPVSAASAPQVTVTSGELAKAKDFGAADAKSLSSSVNNPVPTTPPAAPALAGAAPAPRSAMRGIAPTAPAAQPSSLFRDEAGALAITNNASKPGENVAFNIATVPAKADTVALNFEPAAARGGSIAAGSYGYLPAGLRQQFSQQETAQRYRRNPNSPPVPNVLQNFQLMRDGEHVTIMDADGSTYEGTVTPVAAQSADKLVDFDRESKLPKQTAEESKKRVAEKLGELTKESGERQAAQTAQFFFRATGTNRTLNKAIIFSGQYVEGTTETEAINGTAVSDGRTVDELRLKLLRDDTAEATPIRLAGAKKLAAPSAGGGGQAGFAPAGNTQQLRTNLSSTNQLGALQVQFPPANGRVQGTAVIGKDRLEINAVPKK